MKKKKKYVLKVFQSKKNQFKLLQCFSNEEAHLSGKLKMRDWKETKKQLLSEVM